MDLWKDDQDLKKISSEVVEVGYYLECRKNHAPSIVYVGNWLPGNATLAVHCYSMYDDLGLQILGKGQEFTFNFCESILFNTKFYCQTSYWSNELRGQRKLKFLAFSTMWEHEWCRPHRVCYWALSAQGLFFSPTYPPHQFQKFDGWS
ncbi:S-protein homolog 3-like [Henckelia pumila]|uniref:S-protein homolog 3-like n=1 Tax=Henckelia pumila TaxID=405737 RepID=UPI003C6EA2B5